ncbi:MAG TPA: hypothetical protein DD434_06330 [Bacteroidales bacterium]|nr:hypothetical protein [Bacteroidales bacterium]
MEYKEIENYVYEQIINKEFSSKELKEVHTQMLINCSAGDANAKKYVKTIIRSILLATDIPKGEVEIFADKIFAERWGLGILEKYNLKDVDEIIVHGKKVLLKKQGEIIEVPEKFKDNNETKSIMRRALEFDKTKDLNYNNAIIEAKRADGARINEVIDPVGKYPYFNIRKFDSFFPSTENMLKHGTISHDGVEVLSTLVKGRANILIVGEMESGKTTFINWLMQFIPQNLITGIMETRRELYPDILYPDRHWVQLEEVLPRYPMHELFKTMLRMSVDIMIVGECRGNEVNELIKSMSRGHSGSMGTTHSMGALDAIDDLADMVLESGKVADLKSIKYRIARAIDIVIKLRKLPSDNDNKRKKVCAGIYEIITEHDEMRYDSVPLFEFEIDEENPADNGKHVRKNTISAKLKKKINSYGVKMSEIKRIFGDEYV